MRRFFLLSLTLLLAVPALAQKDAVRTKINEIKRNSRYIYGEATMDTLEEAMELAKDFLRSNIELWVSDYYDMADVQKITVENMMSECQELSLMRGKMYRAFVYVHKKGLHTVGKEGTEYTAPAAQQSAAQPAKPVQQPVQSVQQQPAAQPQQPARAEQAMVELTPATPVASAASAGSSAAAQQTTAQQQTAVQGSYVAGSTAGSTAPASSASSARSAVPASSYATEVSSGAYVVRGTTRSAFEQELLQQSRLDGVRQLLRRSEYAAYESGMVERTTDRRMLEQAMLVIFRSDGTVAAVLSPKNPKRTNLRSGSTDSTVNYPGCGALWISKR